MLALLLAALLALLGHPLLALLDDLLAPLFLAALALGAHLFKALFFDLVARLILSPLLLMLPLPLLHRLAVLLRLLPPQLLNPLLPPLLLLPELLDALAYLLPPLLLPGVAAARDVGADVSKLVRAHAPALRQRAAQRLPLLERARPPI